MTSSPPTSVARKKLSVLQRLNALLDEHVLPYPVRFLTNRVIILATLALLVPLLFFTTDQAFVNALNSYLNVMSVVVSSTVLLYATIADVRDRAAAKRADEIAKTYEQVLEERVQAEHELIQQILQNSIENILGGRLEKIWTEDHKQPDEMQKVVIASNESLHAELAELRELVQALYQSQVGKSATSGS